MVYFDKFVRTVAHVINKKIRQVKTKRRMIFFLKIWVGIYRRKMKKNGATYEKRTIGYVRNQVNLSTMILFENSYKHAMK